MASFTRADLDHVAELAALSLDDAEAARLATDLTRILAYVDELATLPTEAVEPTRVLVFDAAKTAREASALRPDEEAPSLDRAVVVAQAPRATEEGFVVPTFVEAS